MGWVKTWYRTVGYPNGVRSGVPGKKITDQIISPRAFHTTELKSPRLLLKEWKIDIQAKCEMRSIPGPKSSEIYRFSLEFSTTFNTLVPHILTKNTKEFLPPQRA